MNDLTQFLNRLAAEDAVLVSVAQVQGSGPREAGAWMAVFRDGQVGTIGGGHLEWQALAAARAGLAGQDMAPSMRYALGPSLGQCCGGVVQLALERVHGGQIEGLRQRLMSALSPVAVFGGGHVGKALVQALAPLPFAVTWVDSRDEVFPADVLAQVRCEHSAPVQAAVADLPAGCAVVIMSFSHAEDLDVLAACLARQRAQADLRWMGLIGSRTKWATFRKRLGARGFDESDWRSVQCPIGLPGIVGKQPAVIAASVAAQLLQVTGA